VAVAILLVFFQRLLVLGIGINMTTIESINKQLTTLKKVFELQKKTVASAKARYQSTTLCSSDAKRCGFIYNDERNILRLISVKAKTLMTQRDELKDIETNLFMELL
jgi:hypothetical protein